MSTNNVHLEYSRCQHIINIWSTPDINIYCTSGVLQMSTYNVHLEPGKLSSEDKGQDKRLVSNLAQKIFPKGIAA